MRHRKPDILLVLALSVGLGVLVTGYAQKLFLYDDSYLASDRPVPGNQALSDHMVSASGEIAIATKNGSSVTD